jgi:hypothetical protein
MRKTLLGGIAALAMLAALPALAQTAAVGAAAGATTGGALGFMFGGPVGAVIGGFSGAVVGSAVSDTSVNFVGNHPVEEVYVNGGLAVGASIGSDVKLYPIDGDDAHLYFYANNRVWIVDRATMKIVYSPGFVVSDKVVTYVKAHHATSIKINGDLTPGYRLDSGVKIEAVPDAEGYGYVYLNDRPALVDTSSRIVVWVG